MSDFDCNFFKLFHGFSFLCDSTIEVKVVVFLGKSAGFGSCLSLLGVDVKTLIWSTYELVLVDDRVIRYDDFRVDASLFVGVNGT